MCNFGQLPVVLAHGLAKLGGFLQSSDWAKSGTIGSAFSAPYRLAHESGLDRNAAEPTRIPALKDLNVLSIAPGAYTTYFLVQPAEEGPYNELNRWPDLDSEDICVVCSDDRGLEDAPLECSRVSGTTWRRRVVQLLSRALVRHAIPPLLSRSAARGNTKVGLVLFRMFC